MSVDIRQELHSLADELPPDATWDDVAYEVVLRRSIESGLRDLEAGRSYSTEALLEALGLEK